MERKTLVAGNQMARVSVRRESSGLLNELLSPSEPPLTTESPIRRMPFSYPAREVAFDLTDVSWIVAILLLIMLFGLVLGRLFGVSIA